MVKVGYLDAGHQKQPTNGTLQIVGVSRTAELVPDFLQNILGIFLRPYFPADQSKGSLSVVLYGLGNRWGLIFWH
jgi:hypothetical protein